MYNPLLKTFMAVAKSGSFSKAADGLFISPTAVMKQINGLEEELCVQLFKRTNHGLSLTPAGESVLQDAKYMVEYGTRAAEKAREIQGEDRHESIRIGTSVMTPARFVLDIWSQIQQRMPALKVELIPFENNEVNSREILRNLGRQIDIVGGLYDEGFLLDRGCLAAHLQDKRILIAVPVTNPLANGKAIDEDMLAGKRVMFIRRGWNRHIDALRDKVEQAGVLTEDFEMFNISAYNRAVAENMPIITVEGWEDVHPLLKIMPVSWDYSIPFGILYSPTPTELVKKFIGTVGRITSDR